MFLTDQASRKGTPLVDWLPFKALDVASQADQLNLAKIQYFIAGLNPGYPALETCRMWIASSIIASLTTHVEYKRN